MAANERGTGGPWQRLLRHKLVWRLSGLTFASAVKATKGRVMSVAAYRAFCEGEIEFLYGHLQPVYALLEFGCGLGGNCAALSRRVGRVVGIDINPLFIRQARRVARDRPNCEFLSYAGGELPLPDDEFDVVFCWAVFERIAKLQVEEYLREFRRVLKPGGLCVAYYLGEKSRETNFADLLGEEAYVYWQEPEVAELLERTGFEVEEWMDWPTAYVPVARKRSGPATPAGEPTG